MGGRRGDSRSPSAAPSRVRAGVLSLCVILARSEGAAGWIERGSGRESCRMLYSRHRMLRTRCRSHAVFAWHCLTGATLIRSAGRAAKHVLLVLDGNTQRAIGLLREHRMRRATAHVLELARSRYP